MSRRNQSGSQKLYAAVPPPSTYHNQTTKSRPTSSTSVPEPSPAEILDDGTPVFDYRQIETSTQNNKENNVKGKATNVRRQSWQKSDSKLPHSRAMGRTSSDSRTPDKGKGQILGDDAHSKKQKTSGRHLSYQTGEGTNGAIRNPNNSLSHPSRSTPDFPAKPVALNNPKAASVQDMASSSRDKRQKSSKTKSTLSVENRSSDSLSSKVPSQPPSRKSAPQLMNARRTVNQNVSSPSPSRADNRDWRDRTSPPARLHHNGSTQHERRNGSGSPYRSATYSQYLSKTAVERGIEEGKLFAGLLRINAKRRTDSYVTCENLADDVLVYGDLRRNRAMEGDTVVIELIDSEAVLKERENSAMSKRIKERIEKRKASMPHLVSYEKAEDPGNRICGRVVYILEKRAGQSYTGTLSLVTPQTNPSARYSNGRQKEAWIPDVAWFTPTDKRMPLFIIPTRKVPENFWKSEENYKNQILVAKVVEWPAYSRYPLGVIETQLGPIGNIMTESEALLIDNNVDIEPFNEDVLQCLPRVPPNTMWSIPESEYGRRRDCRDWQIFSIDPPTAKDLDDAVSIKRLPDGNFELGVHIADVSYFVKEGSALDVEASKRCTTVYLVQKAIPMLPNLLCESLCSLNPGVERLAFSVIWKITPEGDIQDTWFGRTIIKSCVKLAYSDAQEIIEGHDFGEHVIITNGHDPEAVKKSIRDLFTLSQTLRVKRFENGALTMNSIKLSFDLDPETGLPLSCKPYDLKESNKLIEEFMLLANMSVAKKIVTTFPECALLRRHPPPIDRKMDEFVDFASSIGIQIDSSSSGSLQSSFEAIEDPVLRQVLKLLCIKPMQRAKYFCSGKVDVALYRHYALSVMYYTHFTSPIRRYADVIVHRLLDRALNQESSNLTNDQVAIIASRCNTKKEFARAAQDASSLLHLSWYVHTLMQKNNGLPIVCEALVCEVKDSCIKVLVPEFGIEDALYIEDFQDLVHKHYDPERREWQFWWKRFGKDPENVKLELEEAKEMIEETKLEKYEDETRVVTPLDLKAAEILVDKFEHGEDVNSELIIEEIDLPNAASQSKNIENLPVISRPESSSSTASLELAKADHQVVRICSKMSVFVLSIVDTSPPKIRIRPRHPSHELIQEEKEKLERLEKDEKRAVKNQRKRENRKAKKERNEQRDEPLADEQDHRPPTATEDNKPEITQAPQDQHKMKERVPPAFKSTIISYLDIDNPSSVKKKVKHQGNSRVSNQAAMGSVDQDFRYQHSKPEAKSSSRNGSSSKREISDSINIKSQRTASVKKSSEQLVNSDRAPGQQQRQTSAEPGTKGHRNKKKSEKSGTTPVPNDETGKSAPRRKEMDNNGAGDAKAVKSKTKRNNRRNADRSVVRSDPKVPNVNGSKTSLKSSDTSGNMRNQGGKVQGSNASVVLKSKQTGANVSDGGSSRSSKRKRRTKQRGKRNDGNILSGLPKSIDHEEGSILVLGYAKAPHLYCKLQT